MIKSIIIIHWKKIRKEQRPPEANKTNVKVVDLNWH